MRATKAYIASLGTTGLLLAFSASLLVVVGTLFAFNAWPGADIRDAVDSLVVPDDEQPFRVAGPAQVALDAAPAAIAVASAPVPGITAPATGGALPGGTAGGSPPPGSSGGGTFVDGGPGGTSGPTTVTGGGGPGPEAPIDTERGTNGLADGTEQITNDLGQTVGGVNPQLGNTVSETGQALSDIVRDLPDVKAGNGQVQVGDLHIGGGGD
jgi:hypothetical protein